MDQENEGLELSGSVESVIYKNEENGYTVLRFRCDSGESVNVVGSFPYATPGEEMILSGSWTNHSVHGRQFKADFAQRIPPSDKGAIFAYLAGGAVKGIGPATAALLIDRFGEKTLEVLEKSPEKLAEVRGISLSKAKQMSGDYRRQAGVRRLMEFVCSFSLRPVLAMRLYKAYGDDALQILRENPYILCASHIGGSFSEADHMAMEMGLDEAGSERVAAAAMFELRHNAGNGHCFIPREKLELATAQLIHVEPERVGESLDLLIGQGQIILEEIAGCRACYLPSLYEAERDAAERLARMSARRYTDRTDLDSLLRQMEREQRIRYAPKQREVLELALRSQVLLLTGGPGTGKTTCVRGVLGLFDRLGVDTLLTAPTGRASKRLSELTGREASTVHRLLEARFSEDGETVVFNKNEREKLSCGAVVLDECSMVDIQLMDALLRAMPEEARLILVGDADQLPSVGPGNVFSAILRSGVVPSVRLTEIFRQTGGSRIVKNAHMINRGEHPDLSENTGDFFRLKRLRAASGVETICELFSERLPSKMKIPPQEIQVLSPTRKGELGTVSLNKRLQAVLNPPAPEKKEKSFGEVLLREGDRVMQIRNNYDILWTTRDHRSAGSGIFNGDVGTLLSVDPEAETVTVDFDGRLAEYGFESLNELEHAWAITVHKSQGSEYRAVILALSGSSQLLLTRGVLYTAITRAKELLILVGDDETAYRMIDNARHTNRYSALRVRLRKLCGAE